MKLFCRRRSQNEWGTIKLNNVLLSSYGSLSSAEGDISDVGGLKRTTIHHLALEAVSATIGRNILFHRKPLGVGLNGVSRCQDDIS